MVEPTEKFHPKHRLYEYERMRASTRLNTTDWGREKRDQCISFDTRWVMELHPLVKGRWGDDHRSFTEDPGNGDVVNIW